MADIQNPVVRAYTDLLVPSPPNTDLPDIDHRTITWTFPVDAAWLAPDPVAWMSGHVNINAALRYVRDDDGAASSGRVADAGVVDVRQGRYYESVRFEFAGAGAVANIDVLVTRMVPDAAGLMVNYDVWQATVANPGGFALGPVYLPPTWILNMGTLTNGGLADTCRFSAVGHNHPVGLPVPLFPSRSSMTY